jgi:nitrogen fixation protein FixH
MLMMSNQVADQKVRQFTGRHMLILIVSFFGVILSMNLALAWFALSSWPGLLARNGYRASQSYNQQIAEAQVQRGLHWRSEIAYTGGSIDLAILEADGSLVSGLEVTATIGRPTHDLEDTDYVLLETAGSYRSAADLADGIWTVSILGARDGDIVYRRHFRLLIGMDPGENYE